MASARRGPDWWPIILISCIIALFCLFTFNLARYLNPALIK